jgi:hypothetical protein
MLLELPVFEPSVEIVSEEFYGESIIHQVSLDSFSDNFSETFSGPKMTSSNSSRCQSCLKLCPSCHSSRINSTNSSTEITPIESVVRLEAQSIVDLVCSSKSVSAILKDQSVVNVTRIKDLEILVHQSLEFASEAQSQLVGIQDYAKQFDSYRSNRPNTSISKHKALHAKLLCEANIDFPIIEPTFVAWDIETTHISTNCIPLPEDKLCRIRML